MLLQKSIRNVLTKFPGFFQNKIYDASFFIFVDGGGGHLVEECHQVLAELLVGGVLAVETVLVVFDYGQFMLLQDSESFRRGQAAIDGVELNKGVEEDGDLVVLDQMLVLGIAAILPHQSFTSEISLQLLNLILLSVFQ